MRPNAVAVSASKSLYFWRATQVGDSAELATLICRGCGVSAQHEEDIPLVAVLKDTLGDNDPGNDRLISIWLLTYSRPNVAKRILSGLPFFYWRVADSSPQAGSKGSAPLLDLTALQHPMIHTLERDILQWAMLDPSTTPIRATSRAYRTNEVDHERLHLEEAISYLRESPATSDAESVLSARELNTLIARLELRKTLLGGFVSERAAVRVGEEAAIKQQSIRSRNWELLRQCADKTGLYFEPLNLAGSSGQYAMLWFSPGGATPAAGTNTSSVWKLLNIKNPWQDSRLKSPGALSYLRDVDENGNLLPAGLKGVTQIRLFPLSAYSLNYPKVPLLLIDFRDKTRIKWHEMTQRSINEVTAGIIGISHFTNWYYYVAADLYDFIASRRGSATSQSDRLDCYSQFRVKLQLDGQLDPELRHEMQIRIDSLAVNPLESAPKQEMAAAVARYGELENKAESGALFDRIDKSRRLELVQDEESRKRLLSDYALRIVSFGAYTHRAKSSPDILARVDNYRRAQSDIDLLDRLSVAGTPPEVVYDTAKIQHSISELRQVMPQIDSRELRARAADVLKRMQDVSQDGVLQADCSAAIAAMKNYDPLHQTGVMLKPSAAGLHSWNPIRGGAAVDSRK